PLEARRGCLGRGARRRRALIEHTPQPEDDVLRGLPAVVWCLREAGTNQELETRGRRDASGCKRRRLGLDNLPDDAPPAPRIKPATSRDHFVEHGAEGKDVAPEVRLVALELFRRHVLQGAGDGALARYGPRRRAVRMCGCQVAPWLRDAEVEQLRAAPGQDD